MALSSSHQEGLEPLSGALSPTPADLPLACSLTVDAAAERVARWRALLDRALLRRTETPDGVRLLLRGDPDVVSELSALVDAERQCCPFLQLTTTESAESIALDVVAPRDAHVLLDELFAR